MSCILELKLKDATWPEQMAVKCALRMAKKNQRSYEQLVAFFELYQQAETDPSISLNDLGNAAGYEHKNPASCAKFLLEKLNLPWYYHSHCPRKLRETTKSPREKGSDGNELSFLDASQTYEVRDERFVDDSSMAEEAEEVNNEFFASQAERIKKSGELSVLTGYLRAIVEFVRTKGYIRKDYSPLEKAYLYLDKETAENLLSGLEKLLTNIEKVEPDRPESIVVRIGVFEPAVAQLTRETAKMSKAGLARLTGLSRQTIVNYEAGTHSPSPETQKHTPGKDREHVKNYLAWLRAHGYDPFPL